MNISGVTIDQKVDASKGGFEAHPESYSPRVFAAVIPTNGGMTVYEILKTGDAIAWGDHFPNADKLGALWFFTVNSLSDMNMYRANKPRATTFGGIAGGGGAPRQLRVSTAPDLPPSTVHYSGAYSVELRDVPVTLTVLQPNYREKCIEWLRSKGGGAALNSIVEEGYDGDGVDYKSLYEGWTAPVSQADGCACNEGDCHDCE